LFADLTNVRDRTPLGYSFIDYSIEEDVGQTPYQNVIKSTIDTLISKIRTNKVRAGILPNGRVNFSVRRQVRAFKKAIDRFTQDQKIHDKAATALRNACIFERGYLWLDPISRNVISLFPWEVGLIDSEQRFDKTKALVRIENYPVTNLKQYGINKNNQMYCLFEIFYDTITKKQIIYIDNKEEKSLSYNGPIPLVYIEFTPAINGYRTTSIVDELMGHQEQLNRINATINEAAGLTPGFYIVGPESDGIDAIEISNGNGRYIGYRPGPGSAPITFETPHFIDPEWFQLRDGLVASAYEQIGISQLTASSKNPLGEGASGKALETLENVESGRFQTQVDHFIKLQEELVKLIPLIFDEDIELIDGVTIGDIKKDYDTLKFEFASLSWMSRDPQTRYQEIQNLAAQGLIPSSKVLELMEMGDLTAAYTYGSAFQDAIDTCIENAINGKLELPTFIEPSDLLSTCLLELNQFYANDPKGTESESVLAIQDLITMVKNMLSSPGIDILVPDISQEAPEAVPLPEEGGTV
jgi:hypothetical protein